MLQELLNYGLSEKEAKLYLICLQTGESTANRISELANYPRSTSYDILERLKNMGLISTCIVDNKTNFIANSPKILISLLEEKKHAISNLMPSLEKMYKQIGKKPQAEVFQGKLAIFKLLDEVIDLANKEVLIIGSQENAIEKIGYRTDRFRNKRKEKKIIIKQILETSSHAKKEKTDKFTEVRFIENLDKSKEAIFIIEEIVFHIILQYEITAIKIKSTEHADSMRILFNEMWNKATK